MQILSVRAQALSEPVVSEPTSSWFSFLLQPHWPQVFDGYAIKTGPLFPLPLPPLLTCPLPLDMSLWGGAQLNWSHWNPARHLWDHSPVSLFPRGQCSLFPDRQAQKDSGGHWSLALSTSAAALSRRAQADCAQTPTWSPGRTRRLWCDGNPPSP